jgi:hypothetical protein
MPGGSGLVLFARDCGLKLADIALKVTALLRVLDAIGAGRSSGPVGIETVQRVDRLRQLGLKGLERQQCLGGFHADQDRDRRRKFPQISDTGSIYFVMQ